MTAPAVPARPKKRSLVEVLRALRRPKVAVMLALGFSSGLPFLMIGNTLGYWLREGGVQLAAIGFLSWAGLAYSFKFIWGAVVDRAPPPLLAALGRRRGWMLWTQGGVAAGLFVMAFAGPHPGLAMQVGLLSAGAILTGVSAASQDVVIDAWRIEIASDADELGLLTSAYSIGFRIAIIATDAVILWMATYIGWAWSYAAFGLAMTVGVGAALLAKEPERATTPERLSFAAVIGLLIGVAILAFEGFYVTRLILSLLSFLWSFSGRSMGLAWAQQPILGLTLVAWVLLPVVIIALTWAFVSQSGGTVRAQIYKVAFEPFVAFFRTHGWAAALILSTITLYHLCDYLRGPITNPYYVDLGIPKTVVAAVRTTIGLAGSITGVITGGLFALRFGVMRALIVGGVLQPIAVLAFALLTWIGPDHRLFGAIMTFDGFAMSFAGVALISYMSTLTSLGYTATQYALLTSALAWTGKFLKGFSGEWVQGLVTPTRDLVHAYALFYAYAAAVGIPALALVLWLTAVERRRRARVVAAASGAQPA